MKEDSDYDKNFEIKGDEIVAKRGISSGGDLALLKDKSLDYESFAQAFFDLLHGDSMGGERLNTFCEWSEDQDLPNKWTFVTYFLFVTNPNDELFVKPTEMETLLKMLGKKDLWHQQPSGQLYQTIKDDLKAIGVALPFEVKRGFLDLQSFYRAALLAEYEKGNGQGNDQNHPSTDRRQTNRSHLMNSVLSEVFLTETDLKNILDLLLYKKNIILQGPPGTGKTFLAKRLAWLIMETKDHSRIEMIQFHPSYSYEDFIRGFRPTEEHFELKDGLFMQMCKQAKLDPENPHFLIIDEINRGNLGKIFGELMMLIEKDKRGKDFTVKLPYQKEGESGFYIPKNLHLIGTMNTADRSLAMVDYALRRRFVFVEMMPNFGLKFKDHLKKIGVEEHLIDTISDRFNQLNNTISEEMGKDFQIGHSYFCHTNRGNRNWYEKVIQYEIVPLLEEYWFDKPQKVEEERDKLLS